MATLKKHRLSGLLGSKKDSPTTAPRPADDTHHQQRPKYSTETSSTPTQPDSAYASSENSGARDMQQIESNDDGRNLAVDRKTGEVLDRDTGEVVTTVTTTTTTTTVTRKGEGGKSTQVDVSTSPGGGGGAGERARTPSPRPELAEAPGDQPGPRHQQQDYGQHLAPSDAAAGPPPPQQHYHPTPSPSPETHPGYPRAHPQSDSSYTAFRPDDPKGRNPAATGSTAYPQIPSRHPRRTKSREAANMENDGSYTYNPTPVSPTTPTATAAHNNFSYPTRSNDALRTSPPQHISHQQPSSPTATAPTTNATANATTNPLHNLKAAAIGLHGVGETLRGTINSSADASLLPRSDPEKTRLAREKNERVLERGGREMAGLRRGRGLGETVVPATGPTPATAGAGGAMGMAQGRDATYAQGIPREHFAVGDNDYRGAYGSTAGAGGGYGNGNAMNTSTGMGNRSNVQALSQQPSSSQQVDRDGGPGERKGGLRRLFKGH